MNLLVDTIRAGRSKRPVRVERKRRRSWSRRDVHALGLAAVADEIGQSAMLDLGGIMTGERRRALLSKPPKGVRFGNGQNGVVATEMPCSSIAQTADSDLQIRSQIMPEIMLPGLLAGDISRLIRRDTGSFGRELWGEVL